MLKSLKEITEPFAKRHCSGILYKAPKLGQNPFLDLPVIGEKTISGIKSIGLNGIVIKHSSVIVLNLKETIKLANQLEVFIWSKK